MSPFRIALVGRPNVGKSSLFNALLGYRRTIVLNQPGTTLDIVQEKVDWGSGTILLSDSMGLNTGEDEETLVRLLAESDACLFVVDALSGPTPFDRVVVDRIRARGIPFLLCINKSEAKRSEGAASFGELRADAFVEISAAHRTNLDVVKEWCRHLMKEPGQGLASVALTIAIVGRPNTGKSTLMNRLCGRSVSRVSDKPHTTRDSVSFDVETPKGLIRFVDTAGMRRPRAKKEDLENYSINASTRAIEKADVVMLLIRADEPITDQDMRLLSLLQRKGKPSLVLLNFWDKVPAKEKRNVIDNSDFWKLLGDLPTLPLSGATGHNVDKMLRRSWKLASTSEKRIKTSELNRMVESIVSRNPPPTVGTQNFNILYASQVAVKPPTFVLFVNRKQALPASYQKFLSNAISRYLRYEGQPIRLFFRAAKKEAASKQPWIRK
jgi:GTPase